MTHSPITKKVKKAPVLSADELALESKLPTMLLSQIARVIRSSFTPMYFAAEPYVTAMHTLEVVDPKAVRYISVDGESIVLYFLCNASAWRGNTAKMVKAELKKRCK